LNVRALPKRQIAADSGSSDGAAPVCDSIGPLEQCKTCGCPSWYVAPGMAAWLCANCIDRPEPFAGRSLVVCGGQWVKR